VEEQYTRYVFLKDLHVDLEVVKPHINERLTIPNLPQNLKIIMKLCKIEHSPSKDIPAGSKRYSYCHRQNDKKELYSVFHGRSQCTWTITLGCVVLVLKM
jgi:hypothetical protein